jgi:hypothetical protein
MPSLQQELAAKLKDMKFDDGEDDVPPTNNDAPEMNMTHRVFHYYRLNPMSTVNNCAEALNIPASRVAALSLQLMGRKLLTRKKRGELPYEYSASADNIPDPTEVRKAALIKAHQARKDNAEQRRKAAAKAAKKAAKVKPVAEEAPAPKGFNAAMMVGGLTPFQAKAVYDELRKLFGGTS